jgi:hypothetical protein
VDHIRPNAKDWQNNERKVIVCRNDHAFARGTGGFDGITIAVNRPGHLWRRKDRSRTTRANRDFQVVIFSFCDRFIMKESDDHPPRFILNGWDAGEVHLGVLAASTTRAAVAIQINTVKGIVFSGGRIADAEAGGILDDDPGVKQAAELNHAED